jgi:hypothetical protein
MFTRFVNFLNSMINRKLNSSSKDNQRKDVLSIAQITQGPYSTLWSTLPDQPTEGSFIILKLEGLSQISDSLNLNLLINGASRQLDPLEHSLLRNLSTASPTEPCSSLYIFYESSLNEDPMAKVWAIVEHAGMNKVFVRTKDPNGIFLFAPHTN